MTKSDDAAPAPERLHALDAVRGFALLLGIVLHATLSFMPGAIAGAGSLRIITPASRLACCSSPSTCFG